MSYSELKHCRLLAFHSRLFVCFRFLFSFLTLPVSSCATMGLTQGPWALPIDWLIETRSRSDDPFQRYGHLNFSKMAASRHLGFGPTGSSAIRSADLENPTRTKREVDRMTRCRDMAVRNFPKCVVGRSVVFSCTPLRFVRNVAREE